MRIYRKLLICIFVLMWCALSGAVEWTFETGLDGWANTGVNGVENFRLKDGMMQWDYVYSDSFDPYMQKVGVSIDAGSHTYLVVDAALSADGNDNIAAQFFFDTGSGFAGGDPFREFAVPLQLPPNQGIVRTIVNAPDALGANSGDWAGTISNVRIDPGNDVNRMPGHSGAVDRIAVLSADDLAEEAWVWDFETGIQGWTQTSSSVNAVHDDDALLLTYNDPGENPFDPVVQYTRPLILDADAQHWLHVRVSAVHSSNDPVQFEVYAFPRDGGHLRTTFNITPNAGPVSYLVDLRSMVPNAPETHLWSGFDTISAIRLDPGVDFADPDHGSSFSGSEVRIEYVSLSDGGLDPDHDGLTDYSENELGIDAGNADTDGDGLNDGLELHLGYDPLVADDVTVPASGYLLMALLACGLLITGRLFLRLREG